MEQLTSTTIIDGQTWVRTGMGWNLGYEIQLVYLHGPFFIYFSNGTVFQEGSYKYGEKDGLWKIHFAYDNPNVQEETLYRSRRTIDNYYSGVWFNPDGEILSSKRWYWPGTRMEWDSNYQTRLLRSWHTNGVLRSYEDNLVSRTWFESGNLESVAGLLGGELHGLRVVYADDTNTTRLSEFEFRNGFVFKERRCAYGEVYEEWENGPMDDSPQYWWRHGSYAKYTTHYWLRQPNGNPVRILEESGGYSKGQPCGTWLVLTNRDYMGFGVYRTDQYAPCTLPVNAPVMPPTTVTNKEIRGVVYDAATQKPLAGATVAAGPGLATSGRDGSYAMQVGSADSHALTVFAQGYVTNRQTVGLAGCQSKTVNINLSLLPASPQPVITSVQSQYGLFGLSGIPWQNTFTINVDWGGEAAGQVLCVINGKAVLASVSGTVAALTLDMGSTFVPSLWPKGNKLEFMAATGVSTSMPVILNPFVPPIPVWSMQLGGFQTEVAKDEVTFSVSRAFPSQAVDIAISPASVGNILWQAWSLIPVFGGRTLGFGGQFQVGAAVKTDGSGSVSLGGTGEFAALGGTIQGRISGKGQVQYDLVGGQGLQLTGVDGIVGLKGTLVRTNAPSEIIPAINTAVHLPIVGRAIGKFNQWAKVIGTVSVDTEIVTRLYGNTNGLVFWPYESSFTVGAELALAGEVCDDVKVILKGSGQTKLTYQFPAAPGYLKSAEAQLGAHMQLVLWSYEHNFNATHPFKYPDSPEPNAVFAPSPEVLGFQPLRRSFLASGNYNLFLGVRATAPQAKGIPGQFAAASPQPLVQNVYPHSEPAIAALGNQVALAYVISDPNDPVLQANEIYFTLYDGTNYTAAVPIMDDTRAEFSPCLAFDDQARVVCAWQRVNATNFAGQDATDMAPELEIVYASYDPASATWTLPQALTTNRFLDHTPVLRRGFNGKLMLLWQSNPSNELLPGVASPTMFHTAFWNSTDRQFIPAGKLPVSFTNTVAHSLAYDGSNALFVCVVDEDCHYETSADQELYCQTWNGAVWSSLLRLTTNDVPDLNPQVFYRESGSPELIWLTGESLARLSNWTTGDSVVIRPHAVSAAFGQFKVVADSLQRLLVLWQDYDGLTSDLLRSVYDPVNQVWSTDLAVTRDVPFERDVCAAFDTGGRCHLVYNVDATSNRTDLVHIQFSLGADVAITSDGLQIEPANPEPGTPATIRCRVHNRGDLALTNLLVSFYLGSSPDSGILITNLTVAPARLSAGATGEVAVAWVVPTNGVVDSLVAVVDPNRAVAEITTTNNQAMLVFARPDLVISRIRSEEHGDGSVTLIASVKNQGTAAATNVPVMFRVDERNLSLVTVLRLDADAEADVSAKVWADLFFTNYPAQLRIVADPDGRILEMAEDNNAAERRILLTADADSNGMEDSWERLYFGRQSVNREDDADGDGFSNWAEFKAGTSPLDPGSRLRIGHQDYIVQSNQLHFSWAVVPWINYQIQYRDALDAGGWQVLPGTNTLAGNSAGRVVTVRGEKRRFYRIVVLDP